MDIAIIADDTKKELMTQFCIAYCGILARHNLSATSVTGKYITDATGLEIEQMMSGIDGGTEQIAARQTARAPPRTSRPLRLRRTRPRGTSLSFPSLQSQGEALFLKTTVSCPAT